MFIGTLWALIAGIVLGIYALPTKIVRGFKYENTWGLFFFLTMFVVPTIVTFSLMKGVTEIYSDMTTGKLVVAIVSSIFWSIGVIFWGKSIDHIGISLGFSLFIATVILVGTILPIFIEGFPKINQFLMLLLGIISILVGIVFYGKAGLSKEKEQNLNRDDKNKKSMLIGIAIAIIGGLFATGFSVANTIIRPEIIDNVRKMGNPDWMTAMAVMFPIFITGGFVSVPYFIYRLSKGKAWGNFKTSNFFKNFILVLIMASCHYGASVIFAYSAFRLGKLGNSVGYAIYNCVSVVTAVVVGLLFGEWESVSKRTMKALYGAIVFMVLGIIIIAYANAL